MKTNFFIKHSLWLSLTAVMLMGVAVGLLSVGVSRAADQVWQYSTGFSSTQGANQWYYQQWNGSAYSNMTWSGSQWQGSYPYNILASGGFFHPDVNDTVAKWLAPSAGSLSITGIVKKSDTGCGDGIVATIKKNGTTLWGPTTLAYNNSTGISTTANTTVAANDAIYFIVNRNANNSCDGTTWNPSLTLTSGATNTPVPPTATRTYTPVPPTATKTNTPIPSTATRTNTPIPPTATKTNTPAGSGSLANPGFESQLTNWTVTGNANAENNAGNSHTGSYNLSLYSASANTATVSQTVTGLTNGLYTVSAWVKNGNGGQTTNRMEVKNYGGSLVSVNIPVTWSYAQITISNINVTNGQATIGFYTVESAGQWSNIDDVQFYIQPSATATPQPTPSNTPGGPTATPSGSASYTRPFNNTVWYRPINKSLASYATFNTGSLSGAEVVGSGSAPWSVGVYQAASTDPSGTVYFPLQAVDAWTLFSSGCLAGGTTIGASASCEASIRSNSSPINSSPDYNQYSMPPINVNYQRHDHIPAGYGAYVIKAPITAKASTDTDAHIAILQPDGRYMVEMYEAYHFANGDWYAQDINFTDIQGDGSGLAGGVKASMIPNIAGIIRNGELPNGPITHALAVTISTAVLGTLNGNTAVWPANSWDTNSGYTGSVPMGSLLAIPGNLDVNNYPSLTPSGRVMFKALQDYGAYIIDRGGAGISFQAEVNGSGLDWPEETNDLYTIIVPLLRRVSNNPGPGGW